MWTSGPLSTLVDHHTFHTFGVISLRLPGPSGVRDVMKHTQTGQVCSNVGTWGYSDHDAVCNVTSDLHECYSK